MGSLTWRESGNALVLESSVPVLGRRGPRFDPTGVATGILWRKLWEWPDVTFVTWDVAGNVGGALAVCIHGDPWVKELRVVAWGHLPWDEARALLEHIRPVVEGFGGCVENRSDGATHWWHLHPEARRR